MTTIQPTEDRLSTLAEGVWVDGRYLSRTEAHQCVRCGLWRRVDNRRTQTELCRDCKAQRDADIDAWIQFHSVRPMPAEDLEWSIKNAAEHKARRPVIYYRPAQAKEAAA